MPEIKIKHIVSFSSEDKVHKAENLLKPETYYKWKCASPGEQKATVILQLEKAAVIHSIDIGNEHSAFVEVLVSRSSDQQRDFQVLLVTSSFMSPLESRNSSTTNRVRMFDSDKLSKNLKDEKWDLVQIVCTQPFNKNVQYGLSFIKFHSPPDPAEDSKKENDSKESELKIGKFKLKEDKEQSPVKIGGLFMKKKNLDSSLPLTSPSAIKQSSYASATLENLEKTSPIGGVAAQKRRFSDVETSSISYPSAKKTSPITHVNKEKIGYKNILGSDRSDGEEKSSQAKESSVSEKKASKPASDKPTMEKNAAPTSTVKQLGTNQEKTLLEKAPKQKRKPFNKIMENVVFVLSGFQNPYRSEIRDAALEMGAKYKGDWDSTCTHLVCAFVNTPKYLQVQSKGGKIVKKEWIFDCYKKKELLPWRNYILGNYSKDSSSEEEDDDVGDINDQSTSKMQNSGHQKIASKTPEISKASISVSEPLYSQTKNSNPESESAKRNLFQSNGKEVSDSESDAEEDYMADTDVDSGGDTEDEIRRFQLETQRSSPKGKTKSKDESDEANGIVSNGLEPDADDKFEEKPDTKDIPLMNLPDFFKGRHFFLYGDFSDKERHDVERYITAYNGHIDDYMGPDVKYVVTKSHWSKEFEMSLEENENLLFVRPAWIFKCHQSGRCVPFQPFIVAPDI